MASSRTQKILQLALEPVVMPIAADENDNTNFFGQPIQDIPIIFANSVSTTDGDLEIRESSPDKNEPLNDEFLIEIPENVENGLKIDNAFDKTLGEKNCKNVKDYNQDTDCGEFELPHDTEFQLEELLVDGNSEENSQLQNNDFGDEERGNDSDYQPEESRNSGSEESQNDNQEQEIEGVPNEYGNMTEGRKRRSRTEKKEWKRLKNQQFRLKGKEYLGYSRGADNMVKQNVMRAARVMGASCTSSMCNKSNARKCKLFTEEKRKKIFEMFWNDLNWDQRKVFVCSHVSRVEAKRKTTGEEISRREGTLRYSLSGTNEKMPVCRTMFLNTLGLRPFTVQSWVRQGCFGMCKSQEALHKSRENKNYRVHAFDDAKKFLREFFQNLPKQPSHYVRKDTNKLYLEQQFISFKALFDFYQSCCTEQNKTALGRMTFAKHFRENNLALFSPKKDQCDMCIEFEHGNIDEEKYNAHIANKTKIRAEKERDVERAKGDEIVLLTMDLQAVKCAPYLNATAIYFKTKLSCHNFTVYNNVTRHTTCYWFTEIDSDLTASTFVSCITDYLLRHCVPKNLPIVIYSDGCTFQNRNAIMANGLLNFAMLHNVEITQKFLERGHTQMEVDSVHSCIERKLKNKRIYLPSDYIRATEEARKIPQPYEVINLEYNFFYDYSKADSQRYKSIRPGRKTADPTVTDLKAIKYKANGNLQVKIDIDANWTELPVRPRCMPAITNYPKLHTAPLKITKKKFEHLQDLKKVIPKDCHAFYDSLPHNTQ